jgi:hypothetical protein
MGEITVRFDAPANPPCGFCPYRRDAPSGVWHPSEYAKLPPYDNETAAQPPQVFGCHRQDGRVCGGWAGVHGRQTGARDLISLRFGAMLGAVTAEVIEAVHSYVSKVPLWGSGAEAAAHGMAQVEAKGPDAERAIDKLQRARARREENRDR